MNHEDDHGMNGDSNLSHSVRKSKQGKQPRDDDTNWQQRGRDYEKRRIFNAWCLMHWHQLRSQISQVFQVTFTHCCAFRSALRVTNSIVVHCTNLFNFWPFREFLVEIHTSKMVLWGCSRPPSAVNDPSTTKCEKNRESSHIWGFIQRRQTTGLSVLSWRFACKLICGLSLNCC